MCFSVNFLFVILCCERNINLLIQLSHWLDSSFNCHSFFCNLEKVQKNLCVEKKNAFFFQLELDVRIDKFLCLALFFSRLSKMKYENKHKIYCKYIARSGEFCFIFLWYDWDIYLVDLLKLYGKSILF